MEPTATGFPLAKGGASLVLSFKLQNKVTLIIGSGPLAASRAFAALEADSAVTVLAKGGLDAACEEVRWRAQKKQITFLDWGALPASSGDDRDIEALDSLLNTTADITLACITDTIVGPYRRNLSSASKIYRLFKVRNIPVNTTDIPELCDFTFTSTHRFEDPSTGERTPLQIGVTTNGQGCRLAGRLRREIVSKLPKDVGLAVQKVGEMRALTKTSSKADEEGDDIPSDETCEDGGVTTPNRPVPSRTVSEVETLLEGTRRRMKWVAQVSEYWPISRLAGMTEKEMAEVLAGENMASSGVASSEDSVHSLEVSRPGRILLVGSGPGHPSLLTIATHTALTQLADLVLSDKLVPDAVLAIIPKGVQVRIAKKFPGNAEGAQMEMMEAAIEAANRGLTVVRLKQGDPVVYGRAGEEVLYFRERGFEPLVIPGVSSALAAPTFAGIPVTQRGVAESFIVCTGVGRKGKEVQLPGYERGRTLVVLMGVARLVQVVHALVDTDPTSKRRDGPAYPPHTPIAIIERASMPDQRVVSSTLKDVVQALESNGEQRPPGMMVIGWSVLALIGKGDVAVLDEEGERDDEARVRRWLGEGKAWRVKEGLDEGWVGI
ncbi:uroporphyrin-III C-methyltransferase [Crucibulum laeve]|uniref:precorrin-2 dehydrogenase n=1 Tax=Crucibulum laeve TaxID=68775 RepID=A0A5C3MC51_9AGAR|nr:uroporphyrin-III C-methyltransferase [Crucibulum laeve]